MKYLERYVVLLYERTSTIEKVNESRRILFSGKGRSIKNIPPTEDALLNHAKRAVYQAAY